MNGVLRIKGTLHITDSLGVPDQKIEICALCRKHEGQFEIDFRGEDIMICRECKEIAERT